MRHYLFLCVALTTFTAHTTFALAEDVDASVLVAIRAELAALKAQQSDTAARISALEGNLQSLASSDQDGDILQALPSAAASTIPQLSGKPLEKPQAASPLTAYADFMMRMEGNYGDGMGRDRQRGVMRARLGVDYKISDRLMVGGLLETGDPDDPNSGYVTLSNFTDDLQLSLSRAYVKYASGGLTLVGGKFAKPFVSTDLLWDGDVNPMGIAASWDVSNGQYAFKATGLMSIIDENAGGEDSRMLGGQIKFDTVMRDNRSVWLAVSYYDYELGSVTGADAGDIRSNLSLASGHYLSDFDILDVLAGFSWEGFSPQWPITVKADYVKNLGAAVSADTAYQIEMAVGSIKTPGDWAVHLGYGQAEVDAVLAAFSNDNFGLATNYKAYRFGIDYALLDNIKLNATYYRYTSLDDLYASSIKAGDWRDRIRLNIIFHY
ncbi:MAG: hypothetical protein COA69_03310 [Robiginitomaculum sp.]|nr:MAG: hypothetical protein COA69_03310 [Robiginitomaculum sp.]